MNNQNLKNGITAVIKGNGNQEITGDILQDSLLAIINQFGSGSVFGGFAVPTTNPINTDVNMFYMAKTPGTYVNFGGYVLGDGKIAFFNNKTGVWIAENFIDVKSIEDIEKTSTVGLVDTYTITMTDGSTFDFEVTNGGTAKLPIWSSKEWGVNDQVIKDFVQYIAPDGATATDVPGESNAWKVIGPKIINEIQEKNNTQSVSGKAVADYSPSKVSLGFKVFNVGDNIAPELSNSDFNNTNVWGAGYFDASGNIVTSTAIHYTKLYYPIVSGNYTCNVQLATGQPMSIIIYDSNKNFVSSIVNKPNTDWNFSVPQNGFIRFSKLKSQAAELDYCKTQQTYDAGVTDNVFLTERTADNTFLKTTDRAKIDRILQPKFFLNPTRNVDYSAFVDLRLTGGNESDLKDSSGNWIELYLVFLRIKELHGTSNTVIQIAKKNTTTGVVDVNNISVASGTTTNNIVDANGFMKLSLLPVAGSNLSFDIIINVSKLNVVDIPNTGLTNTLQLNTHYLFETKKQANLNVSKTVVCLGNSITEFGNYPSDMATLNGWTVYNCGFGGCRMARHNITNAAGQRYNEMSFFNVANTIASGDYTALDAAAEYLATNQSDDNRPQVARLKAMNWALVDYIVVDYGTNDYASTTATGSVPMGENTDILSDGSTFKGAMNFGIKRILETYPHIQLIFTTPIYRSRYNAVGDGFDSDSYANDKAYFLRDYAQAIVDISNLNHVENLDLNNMSGINKYTATKFISADGVHPTPDGYNLLAKRVGGKIKSMF